MLRLTAVVLLCSAALLAQTASESQAIAREQQLLHDEEQQRVDAVRAEVASDAVLVDANGAIYTPATLLEALAAGRPSFRTPENVLARPAGDAAWIVSYEFEVPPAQANQRPHRFRVSSLWKREGSSWKLAWRQSTLVAQR